MKLGYYPGCTLKSRAKNLEDSAVASLQDREELMTVHRALLRAEIVIVESLANLRSLADDTVFFVALPLKIEGCDGSPIRAVAIEGKVFRDS